ncbi:MAG: D-2-hydroxyacid dehydrogenase [Myxococcales bacterium]|nr:D-2-hydroxyacid dehydrogenase [Myxococcales bacterium]
MPTVWTNHKTSESLAAVLKARVEARGWVCLQAEDAKATDAEVLLGQPSLQALRDCPKARWVHVTSAGYGRYTAAQAEFETRRITLTKSSEVFAMPCAQQVLAYMLAQSRQLPAAFESQRSHRHWAHGTIRGNTRVLEGQRVAIVGYGQIGTCLAQLLGPFNMRIQGLRRNPGPADAFPMHQLGSYEGDSCLGQADHVVNLLPGVESTARFFDPRRIGKLKAGSVFYNMGRGSTVNQEALLNALRSGQLAAAWLDVTDPEPLPPEHPLWVTPNCYITPHTGGGRQDEAATILRHFLDNFDRFVDGEPLVDVVQWPAFSD